jgi:2-oxoglutarate dehydrogenase E2 component (dihydrolipoamide succinyltransferase)
VPATGPGGRLLKEDVIRYQQGGGAGQSPVGRDSAPAGHEPQAGTLAPPAVAPARVVALPGGGEEEIVPLSPIRKRIAERLLEAQHNAALLTTFNEIDMSAVLALRQAHQERFQQRYGVKLGFMSFFVKAAIEALKLVPQVNAEIRGSDIVYKNYFDIGIAIGGGKGLVVPVVRGAHLLSFAEIELAIADFAARAQANKLDLEELKGGTFTISNGGVYGSLLSTPIVNPPQSGVLGLHAIKDRAVVVNGQIVARPMMYVALTYDHRLVDGREGVTFLNRVKETIEDPARILLEI